MAFQILFENTYLQYEMSQKISDVSTSNLLSVIIFLEILVLWDTCLKNLLDNWLLDLKKLSIIESQIILVE